MIAETKQNLVFSAENFHVPGCGNPPAIHHTAASGQYCGYFVNCHGEQWVITIDPQTKTGTLRGGDIGWESEVVVAQGDIGDLILGDDELRWLDACWRAACGSALA